ncbi:MAG: amino acid ABC transporter substrate-binding protein [Eubacteriaceae bacterium]|nr:amino acid ABC transporter substrate-binding protein [Eubacteriaceae bacterium]
MKKTGIIAALLMVMGIFLFAGCTSKTDSSVLKIGVDDSYPPMEYRDKDNNLVGFDVALAKEIGKKLGMEVEFVSTAWDGIFTGLDTNNYDIIMSSVSITPKRLEKYIFSKPYLSNGQVIVVKPGDTAVTKAEDLKGKKIGVQIGTTADTAAQKYMETIDFQLEKYDEIIQTFSAMKAGYVDYIVVDYPVAIEYVANDPASFEISSAQLTNEPIGICLAKENTELKDKIDKAIEDLRADGTLKKISEEWLGADYTSDIDEKLNVIE